MSCAALFHKAMKLFTIKTIVLISFLTFILQIYLPLELKLTASTLDR